MIPGAVDHRTRLAEDRRTLHRLITARARPARLAGLELLDPRAGRARLYNRAGVVADRTGLVLIPLHHAFFFFLPFFLCLSNGGGVLHKDGEDQNNEDGFEYHDGCEQTDCSKLELAGGFSPCSSQIS